MSNKAITQLKAELAKREKYWQEWNGRAANQIARIEYENEQLQEQVDAVLEICREVSDDWAPEHPPYAAQDMIERIREKLGDE